MGSHKSKLIILSVEKPDRQGPKAQEYQDIPNFRNLSGQDASALKCKVVFCANPIDRHINNFTVSGFAQK